MNILKFIQSIRSPFLTFIFLLFTISAETPVILIASAILYWCIDKKYGARMIFVLVGNICLNTGTKDYFKSSRPIGVDGLQSLRVETATGYSFPSGHTQMGTTFWVSLMTIIRKNWIYILGPIMIIGIGLSRLYLGVHWPIDVIFGWTFGILFTLLCNKVFDIVYESKNYYWFLTIFIPSIIAIFVIGTEGYVKMVGLLSGFILGYIIEDKYVKFNVNGKFTTKSIRLILGLVTLALVYVGFKFIMPKNIIGDYIRYTAVVAYAISGAPLLFKKLKLSNENNIFS